MMVGVSDMAKGIVGSKYFVGMRCGNAFYSYICMNFQTTD